MVENEEVINCADKRVVRIEPELGFYGDCIPQEGSTTKHYKPQLEISDITEKRTLICMNPLCPFSGYSPSQVRVIQSAGGQTIIFREGGEDGII